MMLLLDQGLPRGAAARFPPPPEVVHVADIGLGNASDAAIIEAARTRHAIIVTLDADFQSMIAVEGAVWPSVVRIRREGVRAQELVQLLISVIARFGDELASGAFVTLPPRGPARMQRLPIRASDDDSE